MDIYISGIHSGPDPSAGLGVARSLRLAFPMARLIGVDYSTASTGLHDRVFHDVWVQRSWNEIDLDLYREQIQQVLSQGALWLPCLDTEIRWLAEVFPDEGRILAPQAASLNMIMKPAILAARRLPVAIPPYILASRPHWELFAFCRRQGWPIWCKGPSHEARLVSNWVEARRAIAELQEKWAERLPALQAHVDGSEESITFCAYRGKLLDCVHMQKRLQTAEGKTWAGVVSPVEGPFRQALQETLYRLQWTGGGELEFVRDDEGALHLFDWNPRFPAWIHGVSFSGRNLPAALLEAAGAGTPRRSLCVSQEFARVVMEKPVRPGYRLPDPPPPGQRRIMPNGKHPSGMTLLAKRLAEQRPRHTVPPAAEMPATIMEDLSEIGLTALSTPRLVFLPKTARQSFQKAEAIAGLTTDIGVPVSVAYSVKTNPFHALMTCAREHGFLAEVINGLELKHAIACGFPTEQVILNGPAQSWPREPIPSPLFAVFADSQERMESLLGLGLQARYVGVRLRPVTIGSRFGVDLAQFAEFSRLVNTLRRFEGAGVGVHFHYQSDVIGTRRWFDVLDGMLYAASVIGEQTGQLIRCLDLGGGWFPDDLPDVFLARAPQLLKRARQLLPALENIVIEPGKALAQPCMALVTRVIEVRRSHGEAEATTVVVDGSIADLPQAQNYPHRVVAFLQDGTVMPLSNGTGSILGRNCMEFDSLATAVAIPGRLQEGDWLVFCDAGGYDASMSYDFAGGRIRNA